MDQARLHQLAGQLAGAGLTQEQVVAKIAALSSNPCATCVHCKSAVKDMRASNNAFGAHSAAASQALHIAAYCGLFPKVNLLSNGMLQTELRETAMRCPLYNVTDVGAAMLSLGERVTKLEQALQQTLEAAAKQTIKPVKVTVNNETIIDAEVVSRKEAEPPKLESDTQA